MAQPVPGEAAPAGAPEWSLRALRRLQGGPGADAPEVMAERTRLLSAGEAALSAGDTEAAQQAFDRAALLVHAADTETALVRTYMQAGEYRRALGFGAHAAGAHREWPAASVLYAWLLQAGGQGQAANRMLDTAQAASADASSLQAARRQLATPWPDDGRQAVVPLQAVDGVATIWVRNGLGHTVPARVQRRDPGARLAWLQLEQPLPWPQGLQRAPRPPYAGSPGMLVEYAAGGSATPAWPWMRLGFFAREQADGVRPLGIDAPRGPRGGPVFDAWGRLAGIALPGEAAGPDRLAPLESAPPDAAQGAVTPVAAMARAHADATYEAALRVALQVLAGR